VVKIVKIVVDLQGADRPQTELVNGALRAVRDNSGLYLYLCGDRRGLEGYMDKNGYRKERVEFIDAPNVITNEDDPAVILKTKPDSSLVKGMTLCRDDPGIGGFVSCGATGAIFVSALMILGKVVPVSPILLAELRKTDDTPFCLVDCGANVDCRAEKLVDFARMGIAYMKASGVEEPKVALLSNGAEDKKGSAVVRKANELLRGSALNFIGNVEAGGVLDGEADVIVCDGFSGNILLKSIEGSAKAVLSELRRMPDAPASEALDKLFTKYDYNAQGGAVLLGTKLPIIKGHGAANSETIYNIINTAYRLAEHGLTEKIKAEFAVL
jgi:glycerol-3-phosphate acyltransferase PlsX